jgi:2-epi-5-epi-valiolone 7-kinase
MALPQPGMRKREESEYPVAVFDIGGTWFRSAVLLPDGRLAHLRRSPAVNYLSFPNDGHEVLQLRLAEFLLAEVARLGNLLERPLSSAAISLGAALNARTGLVLNSGPLWGPNSAEFDLLAFLRRRNRGIAWQLFNDITANLLYHSIAPGFEQYLKLGLVTVSTGIGMRTCEKRSGPSIPVDSIHGIQGEIGHIPIHFQLCGHPLDLHCDCGGKNHLNAFCSGRGIGRVLERAAGILEKADAPWLHDVQRAASEDDRKKIFSDAIACGRPLAAEILHCFTRPLAQILIFLFTIDPTIEKVVFTGGVIDSLGEYYMKSLLSNALEIGLYQVTNRDPSYFQRRIAMSSMEDHAGLIGAGLFIDNQTA